jgi:hypothetical protein
MLLRERSERLASIMDDGARRARIHGMGWSQAHEVIAGVTVDSMQERCAGYGHDLSQRATISNKSNILAEREHP